MVHAEMWSARSRKLLRSDVSNITHVEETYSKGKRDRDLESVRTLSGRKVLHVYLEQKADLAVRHECAAQRRSSEAEADMETRSGKREVLIWLFMQPIEKVSLKDWCCIKLINGLIRLREKGSVYVENSKPRK